MCICFFVYLYKIVLLKMANQHPDVQLGNAVNDNEACPRMLIGKCLLYMLIMLILMLLNLMTNCAGADVGFLYHSHCAVTCQFLTKQRHLFGVTSCLAFHGFRLWKFIVEKSD